MDSAPFAFGVFGSAHGSLHVPLAFRRIERFRIYGQQADLRFRTLSAFEAVGPSGALSAPNVQERRRSHAGYA